jgi:HK97 family phage major capsid protein
MELNLHKLFAISYVTDELLQDAPALGKVLSQAFTEEMGFKTDDAIFEGTGVGQPLGILNSGALVTVPKDTGQTTATISFYNVTSMWTRMLPRCRKTAVWLINPDAEAQLFQMSLAVGTGGVPVYLPASGASGEPYSSLFGRPVIPCEQCSITGTLGDIVLADLSSYLLIDKGGINAASSIHLQFLTDQMTFRWIYRVDGQPLYQAPITPFKGAKTLGAFIALQNRP